MASAEPVRSTTWCSATSNFSGRVAAAWDATDPFEGSLLISLRLRQLKWKPQMRFPVYRNSSMEIKNIYNKYISLNNIYSKKQYLKLKYDRIENTHVILK